MNPSGTAVSVRASNGRYPASATAKTLPDPRTILAIVPSSNCMTRFDPSDEAARTFPGRAPRPISPMARASRRASVSHRTEEPLVRSTRSPPSMPITVRFAARSALSSRRSTGAAPGVSKKDIPFAFENASRRSFSTAVSSISRPSFTPRAHLPEDASK